jgi:hypothetical protein
LQWPIWGSNLGLEQSNKGFKPKDMAEVFEVLSFGLPSMVLMSDGRTVLLAFWCEEEGVTNIRTYKLHLS